MKALQIIDGGGAPLHGIRKDERTPLSKLLTSDQLEEFESLLGSKTSRRKFMDKQSKLSDYQYQTD